MFIHVGESVAEVTLSGFVSPKQGIPKRAQSSSSAEAKGISFSLLNLELH